MTEVRCPGLPADWINGWLAAVGVTVLCPGVRLRWTRGGTPHAVLSADTEDPVGIIADSWPSRATIKDLPICRTLKNTEDLPRKVPVKAFKVRAAVVRNHSFAWTLSSTITDLHVDKEGKVGHAPFDPPVPRGLVLHERLVSLHSSVTNENLNEKFRRSFEGTGSRIQNNGLGFDGTRIGAEADKASPRIDPVVETLAFWGLALFPVRGTGTDARSRSRVRTSTIQRGWVKGSYRNSPPFFTWPVWGSPLDCTAIDALLDLWRADRVDKWSLYGIHDAWRSISYAPKGTSDVTRGYKSERIDKSVGRFHPGNRVL